jgi:hypothetical protein
MIEHGQVGLGTARTHLRRMVFGVRGMRRCRLDAGVLLSFSTRRWPLKVRASLVTLPHQLCAARPLLEPGKSAHATRGCGVAGQQISKADAFCSSVNPKPHAAARKVSIFLIPDAAG